MFFDLDQMTTEFGWIGTRNPSGPYLAAFGGTITFAIHYGGTEAVVRSSTELPCSTDCYVDAATGSDTNPGTLASPFLTIQKGIASVDALGTVHVAAGTYP